MPLIIVGLGPGNIDDLTLAAWRTLETASTVYLRTDRHPCVPHLPKNATFHTFDSLYETLEAFEDVYAAITEQLIAAAHHANIVYAVPGDPLVGESTVTRLLASAEKENIEIKIINGISFIEPMLKHLGIDALDGLQIVDGLLLAEMHHPPLNPDFPTLVAQVYSRDVASDVKLTLMNQYPDDFPVSLIHGAGTSEAFVEKMPLYEIDRSQHINHLTSLYIPAPERYTSFESFQEIIAHLRAPEGCPWDRKQTHESLRPYLIEETAEVLDAIDNEQWDELADELGDLLLQIVLHTQIATEDGEFYMRDILRRVNTKLIRRHPHVWGSEDVNGSSEKVVANWEEIKKTERATQGKQRDSLLDGVPSNLSALMTAYKYTAKAAKVGFDWADVTGVEDKLREELDEIFAETDPQKKIREIGDLMFVLVNWLRWLKVDDPESLMREINAKFYRRFRYIETHTTKPLTEMTLDEMDALWDAGKAEGL